MCVETAPSLPFIENGFCLILLLSARFGEQIDDLSAAACWLGRYSQVAAAAARLGSSRSPIVSCDLLFSSMTVQV